MRRMKSFFVGMGILSLTAAFVWAQGPGPGKRRMYDPATETTVSGTVDEVKQVAQGAMTGTHLMVKTADKTIEVLLGPSSFISKQGFSFAKADTVEITGSQVTINAIGYVIAREVEKDGKKLLLRDKTGRPQWAGSRMGRRGTPQ